MESATDGQHPYQKRIFDGGAALINERTMKRGAKGEEVNRRRMGEKPLTALVIAAFPYTWMSRFCAIISRLMDFYRFTEP